MIGDELDAFFVAAEFAEPLIVVAGGVELLVIADVPVESANLDRLEADLEMIHVLARASDAGLLPEKTLVQFRGESYRVRRPRPDGTGLVVLGLVAEQASTPAAGVWQ